MIALIDDAEIDPDVIDALRAHDPLFSSAVVVEPFPGSSFKELLGDIHAELALSAAASREHLTNGVAMEPLRECQITVLVVLGADALAPTALSDLARLRDLDRLHEVVLVGSRHVIGERLNGIETSTRAFERLTELVRRYSEPELPEIGLEDSHRELSATDIFLIVALSRRVGHTISMFRRPLVRLGILAAAVELFDRPRSVAGTVTRLHALDVALHERGYQLRPGVFASAVRHCRDRTQFDLWLPHAIDPLPPRDALIPLDAELQRPLPVNTDTTAAWAHGFDQPRTRSVYKAAGESLLEWRAQHGLKPEDRRPEQLEEWAFDRMRSGAAPRTVIVQYTAARRYYLYLATGFRDVTVKPPPFADRRQRRPIGFSHDVAARLDAARDRSLIDGDIESLDARRRLVPLDESNMRTLLLLFDNDLERVAARIEALRMAPSLWRQIRPLLGPDVHQGHRLRRMAASLNAILLVLGVDALPWSAVPRELRYGSGVRAQRQLREWVHAGTWPAIRRVLEEHHETYRALNWERVDFQTLDADA